MSESSVALRSLISAVAGPRQWADTRESWLNRAARQSGVSFRTIKAIFYGEIQNERHLAVRALRQSAASRAATLRGRYEAIARSMESSDPQGYRADIAALIHAANALRSAQDELDMPET